MACARLNNEFKGRVKLESGVTIMARENGTGTGGYPVQLLILQHVESYVNHQLLTQ